MHVYELPSINKLGADKSTFLTVFNKAKFYDITQRSQMR